MLGVGRRSIGSRIHDPGSEIWAWIRDPGSRTAPLRRFPSVAFLPSFPYSGFLVQFLMLCFIFSYDGVSQKETNKRPWIRKIMGEENGRNYADAEEKWSGFGTPLNKKDECFIYFVPVKKLITCCYLYDRESRKGHTGIDDTKIVWYPLFQKKSVWMKLQRVDVFKMSIFDFITRVLIDSYQYSLKLT